MSEISISISEESSNAKKKSNASNAGKNYVAISPDGLIVAKFNFNSGKIYNFLLISRIKR